MKEEAKGEEVEEEANTVNDGRGAMEMLKTNERAMRLRKRFFEVCGALLSSRSRFDIKALCLMSP